jgi:5,10-methylenetetrahydrofolate reductase
LEILGRYFDTFHIADIKNTRRVYMDSVLTAIQLKKQHPWLEVIPTLTARDRNKRALSGTLASILNSNIENLILALGDRYKGIEREYASNVYDIGKLSELLLEARQIEGRFDDAHLCLLCPINLTRVRDDRYLRIIAGREEAGADIFLAQTYLGPIDTYLEAIDIVRSQGIESPILHNVFPFLSYEDALDVSRRFGFEVSKGSLSRLKEGGPNEGIRLAAEFRDILQSHRGKINGVYVSSRGEPELAIRIISRSVDDTRKKETFAESTA